MITKSEIIPVFKYEQSCAQLFDYVNNVNLFMFLLSNVKRNGIFYGRFALLNLYRAKFKLSVNNSRHTCAEGKIGELDSKTRKLKLATWISGW